MFSGLPNIGRLLNVFLEDRIDSDETRMRWTRRGNVDGNGAIELHIETK